MRLRERSTKFDACTQIIMQMLPLSRMISCWNAKGTSRSQAKAPRLAARGIAGREVHNSYRWIIYIVRGCLRVVLTHIRPTTLASFHVMMWPTILGKIKLNVPVLSVLFSVPPSTWPEHPSCSSIFFRTRLVTHVLPIFTNSLPAALLVLSCCAHKIWHENSRTWTAYQCWPSVLVYMQSCTLRAFYVQL